MQPPRKHRNIHLGRWCLSSPVLCSSHWRLSFGARRRDRVLVLTDEVVGMLKVGGSDIEGVLGRVVQATQFKVLAEPEPTGLRAIRVETTSELAASRQCGLGSLRGRLKLCCNAP